MLSDRGSIPLTSTIPDHHLMQIKWWFFLYHPASITDTDINHIKDLEDYIQVINSLNTHTNSTLILNSEYGIFLENNPIGM